MQTGRIYLFPSSLGDVPPSEVLPQRNIELLRGVRHFVVEELRTARRFLKACDRSIVIDDLHFEVLNEHTSSDEVEAMLAPALTGEDIGVISEAGCPAVADPYSQDAAGVFWMLPQLPLKPENIIFILDLGNGFLWRMVDF